MPLKPYILMIKPIGEFAVALFTKALGNLWTLQCTCCTFEKLLTSMKLRHTDNVQLETSKFKSTYYIYLFSSKICRKLQSTTSLLTFPLIKLATQYRDAFLAQPKTGPFDDVLQVTMKAYKVGLFCIVIKIHGAK